MSQCSLTLTPPWHTLEASFVVATLVFAYAHAAVAQSGTALDLNASQEVRAIQFSKGFLGSNPSGGVFYFLLIASRLLADPLVKKRFELTVIIPNPERDDC